VNKVNEGNNIEEIEEICTQEGWDVKYQQIDKGTCEANFQEISGNGFFFSSESYSGDIHISGASPKDFVCFGIPTPGSSYNGKIVEPSKFIFLPNFNEFEFIGRHNFGVEIIYFPVEEFNRRVQSLDIVGLPNLMKNSFYFSNKLLQRYFDLLKSIKTPVLPEGEGTNPTHSFSTFDINQNIDLLLDNLVAGFSNLNDSSHIRFQKNYRRVKLIRD
jgi:hypothetical protein